MRIQPSACVAHPVGTAAAGVRTANVNSVMNRNASPRRPANQGHTGSGSDDAMGVLSYVLAGLLLYGGLGWLIGHWLHQNWIFPIGMILGLAASVYVIVKRYGSEIPVSGEKKEKK
ncbi:Putative F0F1-ATPase subunit (ATPase_gene1) [Acidipropionibacterium jensenii]|uniref:F0F1-ATPase subunit (ATPase_gene1) n=2 Tax=Acidipropionibacterium jensenii TaxID=1749 RepID=A0A3S4YM86_9ACTN|nr:Putative F0F1-ATPase subunit (ATPase_gene1) [Acidipropionibacterium jensenii]